MPLKLSFPLILLTILAFQSQDKAYAEAPVVRYISRAEDSLHFLLGQQAFDRQEYDSALGHNLAANVPASGPFREALLAQRSRIFARVWVPSDRSFGERGADPPMFSWEAGTSHFRALSRSGPMSPFDASAYQLDSRVWTYHASALLSRPMILGSQPFNLAARATVDMSRQAGQKTYQAGLEADAPEGILRGLALSFSTGLDKSTEYGSYRSYDLWAARDWFFGDADVTFQLGLTRQWDSRWDWRQDNAWASLSRGFSFSNGNRLSLYLIGSLDRMSPLSEQFAAPVIYVDDVTLSRPNHYRGPNFTESVPENNPIAYLLNSPNTGELQLTQNAPQSHFSLRPSLRYGFALSQGWQAEAGARYAVDLYPNYAWDRVPLPDSLSIGAEDLVGIALNRADGRHYAVVLADNEEGFEEHYGTKPLERHRMRRWEQRGGIDFSLSRTFPGGYAFIAETTTDFGWSNLPAMAPGNSQPWHWGLNFNVSHSLVW
ncbi:MAG: hypothetical protein ABI036_04105 [Fibrobacteria bacterium]